MSGRRAPAGRRGTVYLRLPRLLGRADPDQINTAFDLLERADAQNAKTGGQPVFAGVVLLSSPSGHGFALTVDDAGALHVAAVPR